MLEIFSTQDIWLGSYLLSETDTELKEIQVSRNGRETVSFTFSGENLSQLTQDYYNETALANISQLRTKLNFLRDIIFESKKK